MSEKIKTENDLINNLKNVSSHIKNIEIKSTMNENSVLTKYIKIFMDSDECDPWLGDEKNPNYNQDVQDKIIFFTTQYFNCQEYTLPTILEIIVKQDKSK